MGARAAPGHLDDLAAVLDGQPQEQRPVGDGHVGRQGPLADTHGAGDELGHPGVTLEPRHLRRAVVRHQTGHGRQGDPGLAQGGQDLLDVAEEERVGPDHQDTLALEGEPVGVEEVGGPVQSHRRLAGARPTLHHQHAGQRGPDDLVLLPLNGGDDVGHPARPGPVEGGQQGGGAADGQVAQNQLPRSAVLARRPGMVRGSGLVSGIDRVEPLVLQADHPPTLEGEVTAEHQTLGIAPGGPVEGLGDGGPPVHHQRVVVGAVDGQPTDVERLDVRIIAVHRLVDPVDPAEGQGLVPDVQLFEAGHAGADDHIPLGPRLEGAAPAQVEHAFEHGVGIVPHGVEACVGEIDELLLLVKLRVHPHLRSAFPGKGEPSIVCPCSLRRDRVPRHRRRTLLS